MIGFITLRISLMMLELLARLSVIVGGFIRSLARQISFLQILRY